MKRRLIIGLAGEIAAGKTTIADYLLKHFDAVSYRLSTPLSQVATRLCLECSRENLQKLSTTLRKTFGEDLLAKTIFHDVAEDNGVVIVVDGVRRSQDIIYLKELSGFMLFYVEASLETRYERIVGRNEKADDAAKTFEEFKKEQLQESEQKIISLKSIADEVIDNNGSQSELYVTTDNIMKKTYDA